MSNGLIAIAFIACLFLNFAARAIANPVAQRRTRNLALWGMIGLATWLAVDLTQDGGQYSTVANNAGEIILPRADDGHYYLTALINDVPVTFVIDTGATAIVISQEDARAVGLAPETLAYLGRANTANGVVQTAPVRLHSISVAGITDFDVRAVVNGGELGTSLLGMTYLQRFDKVAIENNQLVLTR